MDKSYMRRFFLVGLTTCFIFLIANAQLLIKTAVDKNEILIGEHFKLKIEASSISPDSKIIWPVIPDSILHFEVISRSKLDSVYSNSQLTAISQTLTFTSFDSGKWVLPSFVINSIAANSKTAVNFFTDSLPINVSFSATDTTAQLRDIKPIKEVTVTNPLWYYLFSGLIFLIIFILVIWYFKRRKKDKLPAILQSKLSAYDEAMMELENLKKYNTSNQTEIKVVHSKLGEILKRYLSRRQNVDYLNNTTGNILMMLNANILDKNILSNVAAGLRLSDAVKFAKYIPPAIETEENVQKIKQVIKQLEQNYLSTNSSNIKNS